MMALVWRNRIEDILKAKGLNISDLQKMVKLSYPATHRLVTMPTITEDTKVGTLRRIAKVLEVRVADLYEEVEDSEG